MTIALGVKVKDRITGFSGTVTGRVEYITGCNQVLVAPAIGKDGAWRSSEWFDEQRVQLMGGAALKLDNGRSPGPDRAAPKR